MRLLAIDPGMATGWSCWEVAEHKAMWRVEYGLIPAGVDGFIEWFRGNRWRADRIAFERFVLGGDVDYPNLEPLKIEGALRAMWDGPVDWHLRSDKRHVTDKQLREWGFWVTGSQVDWTDGRDVNDAAIHALTWGKWNHLPTLEHFWPE